MSCRGRVTYAKEFLEFRNPYYFNNCHNWSETRRNREQICELDNWLGPIEDILYTP
jgi:hypothetical protein